MGFPVSIRQGEFGYAKSGKLGNLPGPLAEADAGIGLNRAVSVMNQLSNNGSYAMHAIVTHATISDLAEAKRGLEEEVIPMMKTTPGFVGAYFVAVDDSHGISIEVFETDEQARAVAPPEGTEGPGVTVATLQFGEVIGLV
jgi:hypothetical protein